MQVITPTLHGALDYIAALALIVIPFILNFDGLSLWLSVAGGAGLIIYSLLTDYALSLAKAIPFNIHIIFDSLAAAVFIAAPFILNFSGLAQIYYVVMGVGVLVVVALTTKNSI